MDWYDYGFRNYDAQIGRFTQLDPLTWDYPELTNYQFAGDEPIMNVDLDGLEPVNSISRFSYEVTSDSRLFLPTFTPVISSKAATAAASKALNIGSAVTNTAKAVISIYNVQHTGLDGQRNPAADVDKKLSVGKPNNVYYSDKEGNKNLKKLVDYLNESSWKRASGNRSINTLTGETRYEPEALGNDELGSSIVFNVLTLGAGYEFKFTAKAASTVLTPLGLGSTGRTVALNLSEKLAMEEVASNPYLGEVIQNMAPLNDPRWLGWRKMQYIKQLNDGTKINIHFVGKWKNGVLETVDDFKFK